MDDTQILLRRLSRHRVQRQPPAARPMVKLLCWKCGDERVAPRPDKPSACACGGVYAEALGPSDELGVD